MAKTKISEYDATAGNNTDINSINISEGMLPSNVNNSLRQMMADLKKMDVGTDALTSPQLTSVDINGGTIDGAVIGGSSAAAISGTTLALSGNADLNGDLDVDGTTNLDVVDIDGAVDMASTLAVAGVVTANAGVVVDNITIDGTEIDLSSGSLTIDVAGETVIDSGSSGILRLKVAGTDFGMLFMDSNHMYVQSNISDGDMIFRGNDGGSTIAALTLDMSDAGTATFNSHVRLGDNDFITLGVGEDVKIHSDGTNGTIATPSGNLTLDVAGVLNLDAGADGVVFKLNGANRGQFSDGGSASFEIKSMENNADMHFRGVDNNSEITALTLDMSDAGAAIFNGTLTMPDRLKHTGDDDTYFQFSAANTIELVAGNVATFKTTGSEVTINENSADVDFRVESDGKTHMLFVDASADAVIIGNSSEATSDSGLSVAGSSIDNISIQYLGTTGGHESKFSFVDKRNQVNAQISNSLVNDGAGTAGAVLKFSTAVGGTLSERFRLGGGTQVEAVFNEGSFDYDFRVESDGNSNMFTVDASINVVSFAKMGTNATIKGAYFNDSASDFFHFVLTHTTTTDSHSLMYLNRNNSDGVFIEFRQGNTAEGTISVSGSTVSYNGFSGRHESSGISANTPVGTVVSTIDALDVYPNRTNDVDGNAIDHLKAGQTRADHAKVEVSTSTGDACVYGVVSEFNDDGKLIVTSVGIGSVRVTGACAKGDLLESNGDGTAKVQSDDIVRSKTIGKVTIGNSNTGVKLVSCVMYCG